MSKSEQPKVTAESPRLSELEQLREVCHESNAVCICGCPIAEHENYGEEGEACENPEHECLRTSKAVYAVIHTLREKLAASSGVSAAQLRARIEALEAELAEEHRASLEDPCEQRAERYAMEAAELSKRLTAICREVEALPRWFPSELGSMAQTIDGRWLRREDVLAILRQGEGER